MPNLLLTKCPPLGSHFGVDVASPIEVVGLVHPRGNPDPHDLAWLAQRLCWWGGGDINPRRWRQIHQIQPQVLQNGGRFVFTFSACSLLPGLRRTTIAHLGRRVVGSPIHLKWGWTILGILACELIICCRVHRGRAAHDKGCAHQSDGQGEKLSALFHWVHHPRPFSKLAFLVTAAVLSAISTADAAALCWRSLGSTPSVAAPTVAEA